MSYAHHVQCRRDVAAALALLCMPHANAMSSRAAGELHRHKDPATIHNLTAIYAGSSLCSLHNSTVIGGNQYRLFEEEDICFPTLTGGK
eukprot:scaffold305540_cov19-Tisochrysis_lutea.AAC.1